MECLKFLVVLLAVFQGSLARPQDEVELRAVVDELGRLVARRMKDMENRPSPPGPSGNKRPPGPLRPNKMLLPLLDNYYGDFPSGNYSWDMPMDMNGLVDFYTWYKNANFGSTTLFQSTEFAKMATKFLGSYFRCATMKINQMVFYVLKEQENAMAAEKENTMFTEIRRILDGHVTDPAVFTKEIVMKGHAHTYDTIMRKVKQFRLREIGKIFRRMTMFMMKAVRKGWTDEQLKSKFLKLKETSDIYTCPDADDLWEFHKKIAVYFQTRWSKTKPFAKAESWLTMFLRDHIKDPASVVQSVLEVYRAYINGAVGVFQQVEMHMTNGDTEDIITFVSQFLTQNQLSYLKSILLEYDSSDENEDDFEGSGSPDDDLYPGGTGSPDDSYPGYTGSPDDDSYPGYTGSPDDDSYPGYTGSPDDDSYPGYTGSPDDDSYPGYTGSPDDTYPGGTGSPDDDLFPEGTGSPETDTIKQGIFKKSFEDDEAVSSEDDVFSEGVY